MDTILNGLNYAASHIPWAAIGASGVLSPLLLGIKHWFDVQSEKVMYTLVILVALLTASANYLLHVPAHDPSIIALQTAVLAFMTQPVYFFVVKPAIHFFEAQVERAAQFNLDVKSAAVPAGGLTVSTTPSGTSVQATASPTTVTIQDFKS